MVNTALLAFVAEMVSSCLQQTGFVMQKLAHRKLE